jgi:hypothetical protein
MAKPEKLNQEDFKDRKEEESLRGLWALVVQIRADLFSIDVRQPSVATFRMRRCATMA